MIREESHGRPAVPLARASTGHWGTLQRERERKTSERQDKEGKRREEKVLTERHNVYLSKCKVRNQHSHLGSIDLQVD